MVGIFQLFGFNFLFWVFVGCLRFIFDTLREHRPATQKGSFKDLLLACVGGVSVALAPAHILFSQAQSLELATPSGYLTIAVALLWLAIATFGAYIGSRLYMYEPYTISVVIGLALTISGWFLLISSQTGGLFAIESITTGVIWITATLVFGLVGGHIAQAVNRREAKTEAQRKKTATRARIESHEVAVVIAAHNEELTIGSTIRSLLGTTTEEHIYVGSDGSQDNTVEVVRELGCNVIDIQPNGGKAKALVRIIEDNHLLDRYKAIYLVDADVKVGANMLQHQLRQFDDPTVAAIVGRTEALWPKHYIPQWKYFYTAYRVRLWFILRYCLRYGQTWEYMNASPIIPGGGSLYRTSVLKQIQIDVPGLVIEDFNMTFCVHHQRLGRISFVPNGPRNTDQEPFSLPEYVNQIKRWYLGFFQTVRHHGPWPSWFFITMTSFNLEMVLSSITFLLTPFVLIHLALGSAAANGSLLQTFEILIVIIVVSFLLVDLLVTAFVAAIKRRPVMLIYGFGFLFLRYVESLVFLYALYLGLFKKPGADGRWVSPKRVAYAQD